MFRWMLVVPFVTVLALHLGLAKPLGVTPAAFHAKVKREAPRVAKKVVSGARWVLKASGVGGDLSHTRYRPRTGRLDHRVLGDLRALRRGLR